MRYSQIAQSIAKWCWKQLVLWFKDSGYSFERFWKACRCIFQYRFISCKKVAHRHYFQLPYYIHFYRLSSCLRITFNTRSRLSSDALRKSVSVRPSPSLHSVFWNMRKNSILQMPCENRTPCSWCSNNFCATIHAKENTDVCISPRQWNCDYWSIISKWWKIYSIAHYFTSLFWNYITFSHKKKVYRNSSGITSLGLVVRSLYSSVSFGIGAFCEYTASTLCTLGGKTHQSSADWKLLIREINSDWSICFFISLMRIGWESSLILFALSNCRSIGIIEFVIPSKSHCLFMVYRRINQNIIYSIVHFISSSA